MNGKKKSLLFGKKKYKNTKKNIKNNLKKKLSPNNKINKYLKPLKKKNSILLKDYNTLNKLLKWQIKNLKKLTKKPKNYSKMIAILKIIFLKMLV
jgi:hypothetical protein